MLTHTLTHTGAYAGFRAWNCVRLLKEGVDYFKSNVLYQKHTGGSTNHIWVPKEFLLSYLLRSQLNQILNNNGNEWCKNICRGVPERVVFPAGIFRERKLKREVREKTAIVPQYSYSDSDTDSDSEWEPEWEPEYTGEFQTFSDS